jgi:hypothetical protein
MPIPRLTKTGDRLLLNNLINSNKIRLAITFLCPPSGILGKPSTSSFSVDGGIIL